MQTALFGPIQALPPGADRAGPEPTRGSTALSQMFRRSPHSFELPKERFLDQWRGLISGARHRRANIARARTDKTARRCELPCFSPRYVQLPGSRWGQTRQLPLWNRVVCSLKGGKKVRSAAILDSCPRSLISRDNATISPYDPQYSGALLAISTALLAARRYSWRVFAALFAPTNAATNYSSGFLIHLSFPFNRADAQRKIWLD